MLTGYIRGQELRISTPEIAADSIKYLEAEFYFAGRDWDGYVKTAYFINGASKFALVLADDRITAGMGLNLTAGEWEVKLSGVKGDSRITTTTEHIYVREFGGTEGTLPDVTPTQAEQLLAKIGDMSALETEAKGSLVAAINEAAKSGGGSGGSGGGSNEVWLPAVSDGVLTWAKSDSDIPPAPANIKGDRGAAGAAGAPGIVISSEEPTDPNHPVWIDPEGDETPDNPLGITGATVGQIAKIAAVDASGVPTAWSPVDMPTGVDEEWRKVIDAEVTEPTAEFIADGLNGATELHIAWSALQNDSTMNSGLSVKINNIRVGAYQTAALVQKNGSVIYGWTHLKFDGLHWMLCKSAGALTADNITQSTAYTIYNLIANVGAANTIGFGAPSQQYAPITGKLEVWAR